MLKNALYRLSFLFLIYVVFALAADPLLRIAAVKAGEAAFGAKVEIRSLDAGLFPPRLELKGVAVADAAQPMNNLVEFDRAAFGLEGRPLLEKSFIIREAVLSGLRLGTPRRSSGALPARKAAEAEAPAGPGLAEKLKSQGADFSLDRVGEAKQGLAAYELKKEDLESYRMATELGPRYEAKLAEWEKKWAAAGFDERAKKLQEEYQKADAESDNLKKAKRFGEVLKDAKKLSDETKQFERDLKTDLEKAKSDLAGVQAAKDRDRETLRSRFKMPSLDAQSLTQFLLGPELGGKMASALSWIQWARKQMPPSQPKPEPPQRGKGSVVPFPKKHPLPKWAIRKATFDGVLPMEGGRNLAFSGEASGITSEPALLGVPAALKASGKEGALALRAEALLDHRKEPPKDRLEFSYAGIPMGARTLGKPGSFMLEVGPGQASVDADIELAGDALSGKLVFAQRGVTLKPQASGGELAQRVASAAFAGVDRLEAQAALKGTLKDPDWTLNSNLGKLLSEGVKKALGAEVDAQRKALDAKIDALVGEKVAAIQKNAGGKQGELLSKIGIKQDSLKDLDKKIKDAIEKAQKTIFDPKTGGKGLKKLFK